MDAKLARYEKELEQKVLQGLIRGSLLVKDVSKSKCPVKTGRLRKSIDITVKDESVLKIGSDVYYAYYQHESNPNGKAFFLRNALYENLNNIEEMIEDSTKR